VKPLRLDLDVIIHECENVSTGLADGAIERSGFSLLMFEDVSKSPVESKTESFNYGAHFVAGRRCLRPEPPTGQRLAQLIWPRFQALSPGFRSDGMCTKPRLGA
jgi:hypothetical protein